MKFTMFHSNGFVGLLVCYKKVHLSEIDTSGFISVAISGGSYCILTGLIMLSLHCTIIYADIMDKPT